MKDRCPLCGTQYSSDCAVCKESTSVLGCGSQLIEVGKTNKRKVTPLNKELYDLANDVMWSENAEDAKYTLTSKWHMGLHEMGNFIDELEKRYDITPKQDTTDV